ncbi:MAG: hypothetical protein F8N15_10585 [Methanobacterium sp.]|nr:hypothetical protein [Methanobacterium sp.]
MRVNETAYGLRIRTCADSILATVETEHKVLATLIPMVQAAKNFLGEDLSAEVLEELDYHFHRIEEFIAKWRPSDKPTPGVFYAQPNWAESIDKETQAARKLVADLKEEFSAGKFPKKATAEQTRCEPPVSKGEAFIAMAIDPTIAELDDVHDAIKVACKDCGIDAKRADEDQSNERITDRIVSSIRTAEFVIADLTHARPNVFFEAGLAHGLGKTPIYVAKQGTALAFDIKDYPVIFFRNMRELKAGLRKRLKSLSASPVENITVFKSLGADHFV